MRMRLQSHPPWSPCHVLKHACPSCPVFQSQGSLTVPGCAHAALASRIKYIVDTSEMIWGSLDAGDVLGASLRFLRTATVHRLLLQAAGPSVTARFPLVTHQWSAIEKLR